MTTIKIDGCVYKIHPIYNLFAGSKDGRFVHILKQVPHIGNKSCGDGYLNCSVRKHGQPSYKNYKVHRFIWECFNGDIQEGFEIDHINNVRDDNRLCNLNVLTHQDNCKKSAKGRNFGDYRKNPRCVKAINNDTDEVLYFNSMYVVKQHLGVDNVNKICESYYGRKLCLSKKDGHMYKFEYIEQEDLPDNYLKSSNIKPRRVSDEDKIKLRREWMNKDYICPNCGKTYKNGNKYNHKKRCGKYLHKKYCQKSQKQ